jgi:hypothetical protein
MEISMTENNKSGKSEVRRGSKPYASPSVRSYGNIQDITLGSSNRNLARTDASQSMPAKTA